MTFERPWVLFFLALPLIWAYYERSKTLRRAGLALKTATFVALVLALAAPRISIFETKMAVAILVDTSASVTSTDLARASETATAIDRSRGRNWTRVIPFARTTRAVTEQERQKGWDLKHTASDAGRGTDLEAGVREALAAVPEGLVPRIVVISDGNENRGSIARAAYQARQLGIPIDTIPMAGRAQSALHLDAVSLSSLAFTGERFPIDLMVSSPREGAGTLEVLADGKTIGKTPVRLERGLNRIRAHANLSVAGAVDLRGGLAGSRSGRSALRSGADSAASEDSVCIERPGGVR